MKTAEQKQERRVRYTPSGLLALAPRAFGFFFDLPEAPETVTRGDVAIVAIHGPLEHHHSWLYDSYDDIKKRVSAAVEARPKAVLLSIDSPGGLVSGCFETARELRAIAEAASVPLYAYVDGQATSAAYALACAAPVIGMSPTAGVGSIGIIDALVDLTAQDALIGMRVALVTSGARKADGNPHGGISEDAVAASQRCVDALAEEFFEWVSGSRGIPVDDIRKLEAGIVLGTEAVARGLADQLLTLDEMLAAIAGGTIAKEPVEPAGGTAMSKAYEDAIAALRKAAEGDDDEAKKAKRMLAAELAEDGDGDDEDDDVKPNEDEVVPAKKEDDEEEAKAVAPSTLTALANEVRTLKAEREKEKLEGLLASRPDVDEPMKKVLRGMAHDEAKKVLDAIPKPKTPKPAATAVVPSTQGEGTPAAAASSSIDEARERLHGPKQPTGIRMERSTLVLGSMTREEAKAFLEEKEKAAKAAKGATR